MIYEPILEEFKSRRAYKYEEFAPFYICSFACHVFNLYNKKREVYYEAKEVPSLRMHILFVAPPGWSKSFYLKQFLQGKYAIFTNCGIDVGFEQTLTEAGFVGTVKMEAGEIFIIDGAAKIYAEGILGIDEFSAITKALQTQHSSQLDTQLLAALDHGNVYKRLGAGKLEYETNLTLWAGVQPARFDLTSGMGRRFMYLVFFPSRKDADELLEYWWKSKNVHPNLVELEKLKTKIRAFVKEVEKIRKIEFDDRILAEYRKLGLFPFEGSYFDRLLIGYHLAAYGPDHVLKISMDDAELRRLINLEIQWRRAVMLDPETKQVMKLLVSLGGEVKKDKFLEECTMLGLDVKKTLVLVEQMRRMNWVEVKGDVIKVVIGNL